MSGVQQTMLAHGAIYRVTIGVSGLIAGWNDGTTGSAFGSIQPAAILKAIPMYRIAVSNADDLFIWLNGAVAQDFFKGVLIEDGGGSLRTYLSADAVYTGGAAPTWTWGTGSNRTWNTTDSGEVRTVSFF
jgi:hypothetical protein